MTYGTGMGAVPGTVAAVRRRRLHHPGRLVEPSGRTVLKGGTVIDPANGIEGEMDVAFRGSRIEEVAEGIGTGRGDRVFDVRGLQAWPGLIDMHLHLGDLFEIGSSPIFESVADGVTIALSPGAGNSFMSPALLGAEVDRGANSATNGAPYGCSKGWQNAFPR